MWRTSFGERVLRGAEARLFGAALWDLLEALELDEDGDYPVGVGIFDRLTWPQKIAVLSVTGNALLREDVPCPALTAVHEGAVAAVFRHLTDRITVEVDEHPRLGTPWRDLAIEACRACGIEDLPQARDQDMDDWQICIACLSDRILWDADYENEDLLADADPQENRAWKALLGIPDEYFTAIPPDPGTEQSAQIRGTLIELCRRTIEE